MLFDVVLPTPPRRCGCETRDPSPVTLLVAVRSFEVAACIFPSKGEAAGPRNDGAQYSSL